MNKYITALSLLFCVSFASMQATRLSVQYKATVANNNEAYVNAGDGCLKIKAAKNSKYPYAKYVIVGSKEAVTKGNVVIAADNTATVLLYDKELPSQMIESIDFDLDITKPIKGTVVIPQGLDHIIVTISDDGKNPSIVHTTK